MSITDNGRVVFWSDAVTGVAFQHACLLLEDTTTLPRLTLYYGYGLGNMENHFLPSYIATLREVRGVK